MSRSLYPRLLAGLLFLTACAYLGAALWSLLNAQPRRVEAAAEQSAPLLVGVAVRHETALDEPLAAENGQRLPAGTLLSDGKRSGESLLYYRQADGYEALSPEALSDWTADDLRALLEAPGQTGAAPGGRLVAGFDWAYAALADRSLALAEGQRCRLLFEGQQSPVRAVLLSLREEADGQRLAVFRLTAGGDALLSLRFCRAELLPQA